MVMVVMLEVKVIVVCVCFSLVSVFLKWVIVGFYSCV